MWRIPHLAALLLATHALLGLPAIAQSLPSTKEAAVLLQKAADAADLRAEGTPPYHLGARLRIQAGENVYSGTYDLWWAAPDKYREGFQVQARAGTMAESDLALGDAFYTLRNTTTPTFQLWEVRKMIKSVPVELLSGDKPQVRRVFSPKSGAQKQICVDSGSEYEVMETCLDQQTGEALSSTLKLHTGTHAWPGIMDVFKDDVHVLGDFANLGNKRYPRQFRFHQFDLGIEIEIVVLEQVNRFDDDVFVPPANATKRGWCAQPEHTRKFDDAHSIPTVTLRAPGNYVPYYVLVGQDGRLRAFAPLRPAGQPLDGQMQQWARSARFPLRMCAGTPTEWEAVFTPSVIVSSHP